MSTATPEIAVRQISFLGSGCIYRTPKGSWWWPSGTKAAWPLARLTLRDDGMELRVAWVRAWFPRENIRHLEIERRLVGGTIRIVPRREEPGEFFSFTTFRLPRILPYLLAFRYPIAEEPPAPPSPS